MTMLALCAMPTFAADVTPNTNNDIVLGEKVKINENDLKSTSVAPVTDVNILEESENEVSPAGLYPTGLLQIIKATSGIM